MRLPYCTAAVALSLATVVINRKKQSLCGNALKIPLFMSFNKILTRYTHAKETHTHVYTRQTILSSVVIDM